MLQIVHKRDESTARPKIAKRVTIYKSPEAEITRLMKEVVIKTNLKNTPLQTEIKAGQKYILPALCSR